MTKNIRVLFLGFIFISLLACTNRDRASSKEEGNVVTEPANEVPLKKFIYIDSNRLSRKLEKKESFKSVRSIKEISGEISKEVPEEESHEVNIDKPLELSIEEEGAEVKLPYCLAQNFLEALKAFDQKKCTLNFSELRVLELKNTNEEELKVLANYGSYFTQLYRLDLSESPHLSQLPEFVYDIPQLKELDISKTGINNLNKKFCQLKTLYSLKASYNRYEGREMPMAIFCLRDLEKLDMSASSLLYIDEYIFYLKKLKELNLRDNDLIAVPVVLHRMSSLLRLDLRGNSFKKSEVNVLHDCIDKKGEEQKECKERLYSSIYCEWWHETPEEWLDPSSGFKRPKQSFRTHFPEMTETEYKRREEDLGKAQCYHYWINEYVDYYDPSKIYLLDLTINAKTMREWRLAEDERIKSDTEDFWGGMACGYRIKGVLGSGFLKGLKHFFSPRSTKWGFDSYEVHPERYRSPDWKSPKECNETNLNIKLPTHEWPWSLALPEVQSVVDKYYPTLKGCEYWPTSRCPDWKKRMKEEFRIRKANSGKEKWFEF